MNFEWLKPMTLMMTIDWVRVLDMKNVIFEMDSKLVDVRMKHICEGRGCYVISFSCSRVEFTMMKANMMLIIYIRCPFVMLALVFILISQPIFII